MSIMLSYLSFLLLQLVTAEQSDLGQLMAEQPWHQKVRMFHFPELFAKDLKATNGSLAEDLRESPDHTFIIDFYAPWCPHCNHFAPDMERLALAIQKSARPKLEAAVVDCVAHGDVCRKFNVNSIPQLMYGQGKAVINQDLSKIQTVQVPNRSAETVAKWIEDQSNQEFRIDLSQVSKEAITKQLLAKEGANNYKKPGNASIAGGDLWDAKLAAAMLIRTVFEVQTFKDYKESEADEAKTMLFRTLNLLSNHFPDSTGKCRSSFSKLSQNLSSGWRTYLIQQSYTTWDKKHKTDIVVDPDMVEKDWQICDEDWNQFGKGWGACRGSWPQKRGYTCGLWTLMHFLAAGSTDDTAANNTDILRSMINQFFNCQDCKEHFGQISYDRNQIKTKQDMQLWWWHAHNQVNERVMKIEAEEGDGDPVYPKSLWPTQELCAECRKAAPTVLLRSGNVGYNLREEVAARGWDVPSVEKFLKRFYTLTSEPQESASVEATLSADAKPTLKVTNEAQAAHLKPDNGGLRSRPLNHHVLLG